MILRIASFCTALLAGSAVHAGCAEESFPQIEDACFGAPAPAGYYGHNVLNDTPEWTQLSVRFTDDYRAENPTLPEQISFDLNDTIYEDLAPRLYDVDRDGFPEAIVVESHPSQGARLSVYSLTPEITLLAATPYIGTRYRWLAPVGFGDFNEDGKTELAYIDRPHLAKTLRVWTYDGGQLHQTAVLKGVTNHRIGEDFITSGVRRCTKIPDMVMVDAGWTKVLAVHLRDADPTVTVLGPYTSPKSVADALDC